MLEPGVGEAPGVRGRERVEIGARRVVPVGQRPEHPEHRLAQVAGLGQGGGEARPPLDRMTGRVCPGHRFLRGGQPVAPGDRAAVDRVGEVQAQGVADQFDVDHPPIVSLINSS
ncbi:hypothetical protein GCM10018952_42500 [Streptosporangium vulgare]